MPLLGHPQPLLAGSDDISPSTEDPPPIAKGAFLSNTGRLLSLDGLRGLAVLLVLLDHASDAEMRIFAGADLNRAGKYGVYLFFVLSAFLLTHLMLLRPAAELANGRTWLNYFLRRFLRIFPLYAIVLLASVGFKTIQFGDLFPHLLLREGVHHFWTIPVEIKYYLVLPFVVLAISSLQSAYRLRAIAMGAAGVAFTWGMFQFERLWSIDDGVNLAGNLTPFLLGSLAAVVHGFLFARKTGTKRFAWIFESAAVAALVVSILRIPLFYNDLFEPLRYIHKFKADPAVCGALWTVLLLGMLHGKGWVRRCMEWLPLRYLGWISFSAYLWHRKFLSDIDDLPVPTTIRLMVYLAIVIAVASVSYFLIERPLSWVRLKGVKT